MNPLTLFTIVFLRDPLNPQTGTNPCRKGEKENQGEAEGRAGPGQANDSPRTAPHLPPSARLDDHLLVPLELDLLRGTGA